MPLHQIAGPPRLAICSYKKQPVKKIWGRILGLAWLKFAVAALDCTQSLYRLYSNLIFGPIYFELEKELFNCIPLQYTGPPRQPRMPRIGSCQVLAATLTLSQPGGGGGDIIPTQYSQSPWIFTPCDGPAIGNLRGILKVFRGHLIWQYERIQQWKYSYHKVADDSEILLESFKNSDLNSSWQDDFEIVLNGTNP